MTGMCYGGAGVNGVAQYNQSKSKETIMMELDPNEHVLKCGAKSLFLRKTRPITGAIHPGRNQPCGCGSGVKFKRCCLPKLAQRDAKNRSTVV